MKINISVEATPKEIREVLGLPDLQNVQEMFLKQFQQNMQDGQVDSDMLQSLMTPSMQFGKNFMESMMEHMEDMMKHKPSTSTASTEEY
jgi:hypothetical protein